MKSAQRTAAAWTLALIPALSFGASFDHKHQGYARVLSAHVEGGLVDYAGLKANRTGLDAYLSSATGVTTAEYDAWPERDRLAFLMNVYNAATLRLIVDRYPLVSIRQIGPVWNPNAAWNLPAIELFGKALSLDDLEHRTIRVRFKERRAHFALVCAAQGCPPLRSEPYEGTRLDAQLDDQARIFLGQTKKNRVDATAKRVRLSPIFKWYLDDFGGTKPELLSFLRKWLPVEKDWAIVWTDYDWSLNEDRR